MKKKIEEKGSSVADTIKHIRNKFGADAIMKLDQKPVVGLECIPTGSFGLDIALGIGGIPKGRITEIFGPESTGKTTLALHVVANSQGRGEICAYIDAEHAMDPEYAKKIGVKTGELFISQPESGEQALEILESIVRSRKFGVVVIDSVDALTPKAEIEGEMGAAQMGRKAKMMSHAIRKIIGAVAESKTTVIFINQLRMSIASWGGNPEFTSGGKALKYYSAIRLDMRKIATIKKGEEAMGSRVRVKVVKNKCAPPFKQTEFDLMYNEGISKEGELLALGEKYKIVDRSGSSYVYGKEKLGRGYDVARQFLKANPDIAKSLIEEIRSNLGNAVDSDVETETTNES